MSDRGAIEDVSVTLVDLLETHIEMQSVKVLLSSPDEVTNVSSPTIGLYLYDVSENPHESTLRETEVDTETVRPGPLVVDCQYLLTAYPSGSGSESRKIRRQHRLLGEAMRILRDKAVVRGSALRGSLEGDLRINLGDDEDLIKDIWSTFPETAYKPSIAYTVGPVSLGEGERTDVDRVESLTRRGEGDE